MIVRAGQTEEEFAKANGFASFTALLAASRHVPLHDGVEHFIALTPDGRELLWDEDDVADFDHDSSDITSLTR